MRERSCGSERAEGGPRLTASSLPQTPLRPAPLPQRTRPPSPRHSHALRHPFSTHPVPRSAASVMETPASSGESPGSWSGFASSGFALVLPLEKPPVGGLGTSNHLQGWPLVPPPRCPDLYLLAASVPGYSPFSSCGVGIKVKAEPGFKPWGGGGWTVCPPPSTCSSPLY